MSNILDTFRNAVESDTSSDSLTKLEGNDKLKSEGSWVFTSQGVAAKEGFRNVSVYWYPKTKSYDEGLEALEKDRAQTEDIRATVNQMVPHVNDDGEFVFRYTVDGREFKPTEHAMNQVGTRYGTGTWYVNNLLVPVTDVKKNVVRKRDRHDAAALAVALVNGARDVDGSKDFLWRTRKDGTLRAMLTDRYAIVDNRWFLELMKVLLPGGRLSHWKGDSDTIWGNILIPDFIREEKDSEYGGMLSVGNSEIGERRVSSMPSIFRAICMNGCIWGQKKGEGIAQVHRGKINLEKLAAEIESNLTKQIPLLPMGIDRLLKLRELTFNCEAKPIIAAVASDKRFALSKSQAKLLLESYLQECAVTPELARTGFALANAFTRAGQKLTSPADWVKFDEYGGTFVREYSQSDLDHFDSKAKTMKAAEVDAVFSAAA